MVTTTARQSGFYFLVGLMDTVTALQSELKSLDKEYRELHSNLIKAEANNDQSGIINYLSKIQSTAKKQAEIKKNKWK